MSTTCVAPAPRAAWKPRYGAWTDELADLGLPASCVDHQWPQTIAHTPALQDLHRAYTRLSTAGLQQHLTQQSDDAGATVRDGLVAAVEHHSDYSVALLGDGASLPARLVIDASGHGSRFVDRSDTTPRAWQLAYGQLLRVPGGHPWPLGQMVLMDFRLPAGVGPGWTALPTFLYAMPLDKEHVFVEETSLVHAHPPAIPVLQARLAERLAAAGVVGEVLEEERCRIQMTGPPAVHGQRTVAFGAAGDMVHPATGYQLARLLRSAAPLAAAIAAGLEQAGPTQAAASAWDTLWTPQQRRSWALYTFGAGVLGDLDHAQTVAFFEAFFALSPDKWQGFHSATLPPSGVASTMTAFFLRAPGAIRRQLVSASASRAGLSMLRGVAWA